jgi:DNA-binding response OmpR family regulator
VGFVRILVADSDAESADLLADVLRMQGHLVRTAYSERQSLRLVSEFRPNVVVLFLCDVGLARQIRSEAPTVNATRLQKPVDVHAVVGMIHKAVSGASGSV